MCYIREQVVSCNCFGATKTPVGRFDLLRNGGLLIVALLGAAVTVDHGSGFVLWYVWLTIWLMGAVGGLLWVNLSEFARLWHSLQAAAVRK